MIVKFQTSVSSMICSKRRDFRSLFSQFQERERVFRHHWCTVFIVWNSSREWMQWRIYTIYQQCSNLIWRTKIHTDIRVEDNPDIRMKYTDELKILWCCWLFMRSTLEKHKWPAAFLLVHNFQKPNVSSRPFLHFSFAFVAENEKNTTNNRWNPLESICCCRLTQHKEQLGAQCL